MTMPPASDAIDFVYTWVDGAKNATLRERYAAALSNATDGDSNIHFNDVSGQNRFRDNREIVQSIASVRRFAPFVRKIHIVAAEGQIPDWYNSSDYPEVELVFHPDLFGKSFADMLPTFNSHAIEAMLPFIPGLSERFVYFNDDMFLGAPVTHEDFYDADGTAIVRIRGEVEVNWQSHKKTWRIYRGNLYANLQKKYSGISVYDTAHQCRTLLKSCCLNTWNDCDWREILIGTARDRFRTLTNIPPIELFSNMMVIEKKARTVQETGVVLQIFDGTVLGPEFYALKQLQPKFYCINDDMQAPTMRHLEKFKAQLAASLPHHFNGSIGSNERLFSAQPRRGAVMREIAHTISWLNRMRRSVWRFFEKH